MRLIAILSLLLCPTVAFAALPTPGSTYHLLFASNELFNITTSNGFPPMPGFFKGLEGADWQVTNAAFNAGLQSPGPSWNGTSIHYTAILSISTSNARDRLTINGPVYNMHGTRLATSKSDLFDGTLEAPVDYDEYGTYILESPDVWTGTIATGVWSGSSASSWNNPATNALVGDVFVANSTWLNTGVMKPANQSARLYGVSEALIAPLWGDFNDDQVVDGADYVMLRKKMGTNTGFRWDNLTMDLDSSGVIDDGDFDMWRTFYGMTLPASGVGGSTIPEPSTPLLMTVATLVMLTGYGRRSKTSPR